jgi:lysophospholipase L1-like esterase
MNNPIITASGVIPALSCVKVSTTANTVVVCTSAADTVFGVTFGADTANGGVVTFQTSDTQLDIVTLRAGGTIAVGDQLVPTTAGAVVTTASGQFIAMSAATSGQNLTAYKKKVGSSTVVPGVYGSSRVGRFLLDATTQTDSVDIIIVGDSNTNIGGWGWADGFNFALQTYTSALEYATPITPTSSWNANSYYGVYATNGLYSRIPTPPTPIVNPTGSPALGGTLVSGKASGPAALTTLMTRGTGNLQPNTSPFDYGWIAGAVEFADPFSGVLSYQDATRLSWSQLAIRYRVVHGKGPSMGTLRLGARFDEDSFTTIATTSVACAQASYEWVTSELLLTADSARTNKAVAYAFAADNFVPSCKITGPMAIALNSICTQRKGYAVTCMNHHGGASMDTVAGNVVQAATIMRQYLKEARSRQIVCGGSGRVVVCIQGGCNDGVNPWGQSATTFFEQCATEWAALGYPSSDLAFLGFVSHQENNPDDMTAERSSAIALAASSPQYTIVNILTFVSFNDMTYGGGSNVTWFANASTERIHLSESGYKAISGRIITRLLASA